MKSVRIRGPGTAETAVGSGDDEEAEYEVGQHIGDRPSAEHAELRGEGLGDVGRLEAVKLEGDYTTFADGAGDALVHAGSGAAQHCASNFLLRHEVGEENQKYAQQDTAAVWGAYAAYVGKIMLMWPTQSISRSQSHEGYLFSFPCCIFLNMFRGQYLTVTWCV